MSELSNNSFIQMSIFEQENEKQRAKDRAVDLFVPGLNPGLSLEHHFCIVVLVICLVEP